MLLPVLQQQPYLQMEENTIGDLLPPSKAPNITRVHFINVNRITYETTGNNSATIGKAANDHGIDMLGIAETHNDTTRFPVRETLSEILIQHTLNWVRPVVIDYITLTENLEDLCC
jgi:hypothetical protein